MTKQEIIKAVKSTLLEIYGENLQISESPESIDWNFDGGLHMCSLVFVGDKYEVKLDKTSICGNCENFQEQWFRDRAKKAAKTKPLGFLEKLLRESDPQRLWEQHHGEAFRLELKDGKLGWAMSCSDGNKFIYTDGVCKKLEK